MDPIRTYDYLVLARGRVMDAVRTISPAAYETKFGFGLGTIASTLTHIMVSEWYYIERFQGHTIRPYAEWPIQYEKPPAFAVLEAAWREQAALTRRVLAAERDWHRRIEYDSFPDDKGKRFHIAATATDYFTQLALHEVHHRAQAMSMLRELSNRDGTSPTVQDIDFNDLMYEWRVIG